MQIQSTTLHLDNLRLFAHHGVLPQETRVGAFFTLSLEIEVDFTQAVYSDDLRHTVSYAEIYERVKAEMGIPSKLLEHVAGRILQRLYADFPAIQAITLRLDKDNPPMGAQCQSCGVQLVTRR